MDASAQGFEGRVGPAQRAVGIGPFEIGDAVADVDLVAGQLVGLPTPSIWLEASLPALDGILLLPSVAPKPRSQLCLE